MVFALVVMEEIWVGGRLQGEEKRLELLLHSQLENLVHNTMRTFHIGGAASRAAANNNVQIKSGGNIKFVNLKTVAKADGNFVAVSRSGELVINDGSGRSRERHKVPYGSLIVVADGAPVSAGQVVASWDPHTKPIITELNGVAAFLIWRITLLSLIGKTI